MSQENVEIVRGLIPPPDVDVAPLFRSQSLFSAAAEPLEGALHPDLESCAMWQENRIYSGVAGFREMWLDWLEPWEAYYVHVDDTIDAGDKVVLLIRDRAHRPGVEAEVELVSASIWEFRHGRIVRVTFCRDRSEALEAAGLSE